MLDSFLWELPSLRKLYCKVAFLHVELSIVYASVFFKVGSRHFSFPLVTNYFGVFWSDVLWRTASVPLAFPTSHSINWSIIF